MQAFGESPNDRVIINVEAQQPLDTVLCPSEHVGNLGMDRAVEPHRVAKVWVSTSPSP